MVVAENISDNFKTVKAKVGVFLAQVYYSNHFWHISWTDFIYCNCVYFGYIFSKPNSRRKLGTDPVMTESSEEKRLNINSEDPAFWLRQELKESQCLCVCLSDTSLSRALNIQLSV